MSKNDSFIKINILALGNTSVGKTSFILKYTENNFREVHLSTIGIDYKTKIVKLENGKKYKVDFYDTAGQEKYKSIALNVIKNADGVILMYDVTKKESFESISRWMEGIKAQKETNFPIILVGNKIDKEDERLVTKEDGQNLANKFRIKFFEISNKEGINIEECALSIINEIADIKEGREDNDILKLNRENNNNENNCSC